MHGENHSVSRAIEFYIQEKDGRPILIPATSLIKIPYIIRGNKTFCFSLSILANGLIAYKITCKELDLETDVESLHGLK